MGRVDEAMRRAAQAGGVDVPSVSTEAAPGIDADALPPEPFPLEISERRRRRPIVLGAPGGSERLSAVPAASPVPAGDRGVRAPAPADAKTSGGISMAVQATPTLAAKLVVDQQMTAASREQYRQLAASLLHVQTTNGTKVVMITSAMPGEGKTLTAANLALTLAESYHRNVLLIDADLRRPSQHTVFNVDGSSGLSDALQAAEEDRLTLHQISATFALLAAGTPTADPMGGLTSDRMRRLVEEARELFDWIIIDTPPVGLLTDANLLAAIVDGALIVIKAEETPYDLVRRAIDAVGKDRIFGIVLNGTTLELPASKYGYYEYYNQSGRSSAASS